MAFPLIPVIAVAAFALFRKKDRPSSRAIHVFQGESTESISVKRGERLSIHFVEIGDEEWQMVDAPDSFLLGAIKLKWKEMTGGKRIRAFDFAAKRPGETEAEFVKFREGQQEQVVKIKIEVN